MYYSDEKMLNQNKQTLQICKLSIIIMEINAFFNGITHQMYVGDVSYNTIYFGIIPWN